MSTILDHDRVVTPDPAERDGLVHLNEAIQHIDEQIDAEGLARIVAPDGTSIEVPTSAFEGLRAIADDLAHGRTVFVLPQDRLLTTNEAANVLNISRQFLVRLLDRGDLPYQRVGTHRRLTVPDVLAYQEQRAARRQEKLDKLTRLSEEYEGGYR